jgi:hypothetical protein
MNLYTYFQHQKTSHLSDQKKAELFQRICQKRLQQSVRRQHLFSYKRITYACIAVVFAFFVFGGVMIQKYVNVDNLFFSSTPGNLSSVYAGYIAEIIEFNGEYTIKNNDKILSSQYIHNGDIICLKTGSEMLLTLNDNSQAKIVGPAEFSISQAQKNTYKILLIQGNFFKIFNETADNDIEIIADDISIQTNKNQTLDLQIAKEGKEVIIKNDGGATKITTQKNNTKVEKTLTKEIICIKDHDINSITDTKTFTDFLSKNNISETLSLSSSSQSSGIDSLIVYHEVDKGDSISEIELLDPDFVVEEWLFADTTGVQFSSGEVNEEIKSDLGLQNEKKIPSPDQNSVLKTALNSFFLMNNVEKIAKATLENNTEKAEEYTKELSSKVHTIAASFGVDKESSATFASIKKFSSELKNTLSETYFIAPSYLTQLEKIADRCDYLTLLAPIRTSTGASATLQADLQRESLKSTLPAHLQFD